MATPGKDGFTPVKGADTARSDKQTDRLCFNLRQEIAQLALLTLQLIQSPPLTRTVSQLF